MGQALYRKYRSKTFSEVIGQEPITETLDKAIKSGRISHAYLLSGPKGVGKTSVARILAHAVNNLAYIDESIHLDIIEIDAASNRRIDEIRDIREKVHIAPTSAKYKVYIIDEVHMLTKEPFNALLKTLEEPPAHCIFILATTEPHKLPETIISRTQRFNFRPVETTKVVAHLKNIAKKEKIIVDPAVLELLAEHSEGSFRDSIGMLDQLSGADRLITESDARQLLGLPPADSVSKLIEFIDIGASGDILSLLGELKEAGNSPALIAVQLSKRLRSEIITAGVTRYSWTTSLLKNLLDVSGSKQPFEILEVSLLEAAQVNHQLGAEADTRSEAVVADLRHKPAEEPMKNKVPGDFNLALWPDALNEIKKRVASIYTALRLAKPEVKGSVMTLTFQFPLHKKKVERARHTQLISEVIEDLSGAKIEVKCVLSEKLSIKPSGPKPSRSTEPTLQSDKLATISNIFGSAEMLES
ncbi:MAG: DNA polymerase III subunit gamma/tau [Patescibacteria group bacterium]